MSGEGPRFFARTASGMVRELSPLVTFAICTSAVAIGIPANFAVIWTAGIYPGADFIGHLTAAMIPSIFVGLLYVLFTIAMPRSGGDYIFCSRILHPAIGFMMNFMFTFWLLFFVGFNASVFIDFMLAPVLASYGLAIGNVSLVNLANLLATDINVRFIGAFISLVIIFAILLLGARYTGRWLLGLFIVGLIGLVANIIIYLVFPPNAFPVAYQKAFGVSVEETVNLAKEAGWQFVPITLEATIAALPFGFLWYIGFHYAAYVAGEVKEVRKSSWIAVLGSLIFGWIMYSIIGALFLRTVGGYEFAQAISFLFFAAPDKYPLPTIPGAYLFAGIMSPSPILNLIILVAQICWNFAFTTVLLMVIIRNMFAWAFDRVIPTSLADVSRRFRSPVKATILAFIISIIFLYIYVYTDIFVLLVNFIMAVSIAFIIPGIAGIVFPFRARELYQQSPIAKFKVGPIPLISIAGFISAIFFAVLVYTSYVTPGVFGPTGLPALSFILFSMILPLIIYYSSRWYHLRREGIDISLAFKEIPPA